MASNSMNLDIPVPGQTTGPEWAQKLQTALNQIAEHTHTINDGVKITQEALEVTGDLDVNGNNVTEVKTIRFNSLTGLLQSPADVGNLSNVNGDLWWTNAAGTGVQLTSGGGINIASVGTIGGDYGQVGVPASVNYSDLTKTFSFLQDSGISAKIFTGTINLAHESVSANSVSLSAAQTSDAYSLVFPTSAPTANSVQTFDNTGASTFRQILGTANQITVSNSNTAFTLSLPSSLSLSAITGTTLSLSSTLAVSGASSLSTLSTSGLATLNSLTVTGATTLATTTLTSTFLPNANNTLALGSSGLRWSNTFTTLLNVSGTSTLAGLTATTGSFSSTLAVTGAATLSSTLAVSGTTTLSTANITTANITTGNITTANATTVNSTTHNVTGNLFVNTSNTSGAGIKLSDDGDIVDMNDGYAAMRFSNGVRVYSGNASGTTAVTLGANGAIATGGESTGIKWKVFTGTAGSSGTGLKATLTVSGTVLGCVGMTNVSAGADYNPMPLNSGGSAFLLYLAGVSGTGDSAVGVYGAASTVASQTYRVVVYYI